MTLTKNNRSLKTVLTLEEDHETAQAQLFSYDSNYLLFHHSISQLGKTGIFLPLEVFDDHGLVLE